MIILQENAIYHKIILVLFQSSFKSKFVLLKTENRATIEYLVLFQYQYEASKIIKVS